jgi:hypothetical protein
VWRAIGTTPQLAQKLVFCNSGLDKSIIVCKMGSEGIPPNPFRFGKSIHVHKVHVYEVYAHEVHVCEIHVNKVHTHEMHAMRYTPMRYTQEPSLSSLSSILLALTVTLLLKRLRTLSPDITSLPRPQKQLITKKPIK